MYNITLEKHLLQNPKLAGLLISNLSTGISLNFIEKSDRSFTLNKLDKTDYLVGPYLNGSLLEAIYIFSQQNNIPLSNIFNPGVDSDQEEKILHEYEQKLKFGFPFDESILGIDLRLYLGGNQEFVFEVGLIPAASYHSPELNSVILSNTSTKSFHDAYSQKPRDFYSAFLK